MLGGGHDLLRERTDEGLRLPDRPQQFACGILTANPIVLERVEAPPLLEGDDWTAGIIKVQVLDPWVFPDPVDGTHCSVSFFLLLPVRPNGGQADCAIIVDRQ